MAYVVVGLILPLKRIKLETDITKIQADVYF